MSVDGDINKGDGDIRTAEEELSLTSKRYQ